MVTDPQKRAEEQKRREQLKLAEAREVAALKAAEQTRQGTRERRLAVQKLDQAKRERKAKQRELQAAKERRKIAEGKKTVKQLRAEAKAKKAERERKAREKTKAFQLKQKSLALEKKARTQAKVFVEQQRKKKIIVSKKKQKQIQQTTVKVVEEFKTFSQPDTLLINKAVTGQTITPTEQKKLQDIVQKQGDKLTKKQITLLKRAPKDIATGLFEVGKELLSIPVVAVKKSFKFGRGLRKRFEAGENNPLFNDVKKLGVGTANVAKFVKNNPGKAASIVALAGGAATRQFGTAFVKNPVKTTTKAVAYLFPGTIIKGGIKTAKLGQKGVQTVAQAKRLQTLDKAVKPARAGGLTTAQTKRLDAAVGAASKIGDKTKQSNRIKTTLKGILKERGVKPSRAASVQKLANQVKGSKAVPIKVKKVIKKPKPVKDRPVALTKLQKAKLEVGKVVAIPKTVKGRKVITRVKVGKGGKLKKITKKEFDSIKAKEKVTKKADKASFKKEQAKAKKKLAEAKKKEKAAFEKQLKEKGVAKDSKGVINIDVNAVRRLDNPKAPVKPVLRSKFGKKGQARMQIQIKKQISATRKKAIKTKNKKELKKLRAKLFKLRNVSRAIRITGVIIAIGKVIKAIDLREKQITGKIPATKPKVVPVKKPAKTPAKKPAKKPGVKPAVKKAVAPKKATPLKKVAKVVPKKAKKAPPKKPVRKIKFPSLTFDTKLPAGTRLKFDIKFKERGRIKTRKLGLPLNKAIKKGFGGVDKTTQASAQLVISGVTRAKDIPASQVKKLKAKFRFKKSKDKKVLRFVEIKKARIDTRGEKQGLKLSKLLKPKKKPKKTRKKKKK